MKHKAKQVEIGWTEPEPFKLTIQTTLDGERLAREKAQRQADAARSEELQTDWTDVAKSFQRL